MKRRAVVFDYDGVLTLITPENFETMKEIESKLGLKIHELTDFIEQWGKSWYELWKGLEHEEYIDEINEKFFELTKKEPKPAPDINKVLSELKKGYYLGVVSNHSEDYLHETLDEAEIKTDIFDFILGSGENKTQKPDWRVFSKLPKETEKVIYVGDTDIDYNTVNNARRAKEFEPEISFVGVS